MPASRLLPAVLTALAAKTSCAPPATRLEPVPPAAVRAEALVQQRAFIEAEIAEQRRLLEVAYPLLRAAAPLCGTAVRAGSGLQLHGAREYAGEFDAAARALGLGDTLRVTGVAPRSAAARAGLAVGHRLAGVSSVEDAIATGVVGAPDTICAFDVRAVREDRLSAWADGHALRITSPMLRFAASDDALAVVLAHELAHNALRHAAAQRRRAQRGSLAGAVLDAVAAVGGLNSGGSFSQAGRHLGSLVAAHDVEREADHVGAYILARAGRDVRTAARFWRRVAQESPGSITYADRHPSTAERFVRMERAAAEIAAKRAAGEPLLPTLRAPSAR